MKSTIFSFIFILHCFLWNFAFAGPQESRLRKLKVPSASFPTIQRAIEASVDGDTIIIKPGVYFEMLHIEGKSITLKGSGSKGDRRTEIQGKRPVGIVPPERAVGCIHFGPQGGGTIKKLMLHFSDAGIIGEKIGGALPADIFVKDVSIEESTRGFLGSFANLSIKKTAISKTT
jgi:hypothetical protein